MKWRKKVPARSDNSWWTPALCKTIMYEIRKISTNLLGKSWISDSKSKIIKKIKIMIDENIAGWNAQIFIPIRSFWCTNILLIRIGWKMSEQSPHKINLRCNQSVTDKSCSIHCNTWECTQACKNCSLHIIHR